MIVTSKTLERRPFVARLLQHVDLTADDLKSFDDIIDGELSIRRKRDLIVTVTNTASSPL